MPVEFGAVLRQRLGRRWCVNIFAFVSLGSESEVWDRGKVRGDWMIVMFSKGGIFLEDPWVPGGSEKRKIVLWDRVRQGQT